MSRRVWKLWLLCSLTLVALLLSTAVWAKSPALFGAGGGKKEQKAAPAAQPPANLTPGQVDHYLATLSDEQARQALAQELKEKGATKPSEARESMAVGRASPIGRLFFAATEGVSSGLERLRTSASRAAESAGTLSSAFETITGGKGAGQLVMSVLGLLAIIGAGLVAERVFIRATEGIRHQLLAAVPLGRLQKLGLVVSRMLLEVVGVALYVLVTFLLFVLAYDKADAGYLLVSLYLIGSYYFKLFMFAAKVVLAPRAPGLRLFPLGDEDARFLYRWMLRIVVTAVVVAAGSFVFKEAGVSQELFSLMYCTAGVTIILLLIASIWQIRRRVALAICPEREPGAGPATSLRASVARNWHVLAIFYVIVTGSFWVVQELMGGNVTVAKMIMSLFLIPIFIAIDQWVERLLKIASGELPEIIDLSGDGATRAPETQSRERRADLKYYLPVITRLFRGVLAAFLLFVTLRLWGIDLAIGRLFTSHVLSIVVALLLGFIAWETTKARIDAKLKEEMPEEGEEMDEGGEGGTRRGTLLVLLRKFILTVVFVTVGLIVLSSIGVEVAPLIAGAGVIGIAIGFGAQTLVRDIISGIFYLLDDSFRVGDYVESAGAKGTVEQISLRSLKLRHPRGMVYTIPYGRMGTVTNWSRDYNITKLDIRLRFDTDLDEVRKIIKKLNKEIMKEEEFKSALLEDIRSQGVREIDDSAMILRVKYKTLPGQQFVLRREIYRRLQEAFREQGIEFAHRNVTVYLPPEVTQRSAGVGKSEGAGASQTLDKTVLQASAAAAGLAVALADEEKKKAELESKKPKAGGGE
jgi:moderate conductance mechanosensitive channel